MVAVDLVVARNLPWSPALLVADRDSATAAAW